MELSPKHIKLLQKTKKKTVIRTDKYDIKDLEYLRSLDLITAISCDKKDDYFYQAFITEKGKAVLSERLHSNRRANIALVLSILALLVSFLVAFTPFAEWSQDWISTLIQSISS